MAKSHLKLRYARFFFKLRTRNFLTYAPAVADE